MVKVQRPHVRAQVEADIDIILWLITPDVRLYAFVGYVVGFVGFVLALRAFIHLFGSGRW